MPPFEPSLLEAKAPGDAPPPSGRSGLVAIACGSIACGSVAVAAMASIAWWSADLGGT